MGVICDHGMLEAWSYGLLLFESRFVDIVRSTSTVGACHASVS